MARKEGQTPPLQFLSQPRPPAWVQIVDPVPDQGALDLTAQLQEITTRRHRLYFIRCTIRYCARHYHLRIAGALPARNKMLGLYRVIDPPCYRVAAIPKLLQEATAQLKNTTKIYPLQAETGSTFLSLSGILFVGSTAEQRYVLHEHLKDLGLAGPPAPILHWNGQLREGPDDINTLSFQSLSALPAELLAIPVPTTSWAFEDEPVMTCAEWEVYRRRSMTTVVLPPTEDYDYGVFVEDVKKLLSAFLSVWPFICWLCSYLPRLSQSALSSLSSGGLAWRLPRQPVVLLFFSTSTDAVWAWCPGHR